MEYLAPEPINSDFYSTMAIVGVAILLFVIFSMAFSVDKLDRLPKWFGPVWLVGLFCGVGLSAVGVTFPSDAESEAVEERNRRVASAIEETYGLKLTEREMDQLKYPVAEPESDFEAFGSIEKVTKAGDKKLIERKLYLVWNADSFGIFQSENGEDFLPLETQN